MQVNIVASDKKKLINILKNDPIMHGLMTSDYSQIDTWIDNNVNTLTDARELFKRLFKSIKYLLANLIREM